MPSRTLTGGFRGEAEPKAQIAADHTINQFENASANYRKDIVAATAIMTGILDNNTIPAALDAQTITITDAAGLAKIYKFFNGGGKSTGDLDSGNIVIQLNGVDEKEALVDDIRQAIESSNGHDGSITVSRDEAVITLTQAGPFGVGNAGNTTIAFSAGINTSTELSKTNFSGGIDMLRQVPFSLALNGVLPFNIGTELSDTAYTVTKGKTFNND
jgi:hypothetical protein|tara:strand:+ start:1099 stop:1743 length:645 start_codon:yes stop_codon:yes gene_type:complete